MENKYFGRWDGWDDFSSAWSDYDYSAKTQPIVDGLAKDGEILFASYGGGSYAGDALVLFERDGDLYENTGSHCSCYDLEGQWEPEKTTWDALARRNRPSTDQYSYHCLSEHDSDAIEAFWKLVDSHVPPTAAPIEANR
jgi:hypothetical protein